MGSKKYLIYNDSKEAIQRNEELTTLCDFKDGVTTTYCNVRKHPELDKWAIVIAEKYQGLFTEEEINNSVELTEDWIIKFETK